MRKTIALLLALAVLLASVAACAETMITTVSLSNLFASYIDNGKVRTAHLENMGLSMSVGETEGVPTLLVNFDNGKGQSVDGVFQVVGDRLLVSVGGISGTYYVDLESVCKEPGSGAALARGLGSGLALAGPHLDALLQALSTTDASGERQVRFDLPADIYNPIADSVMGIVDGISFIGGNKAKAVKERLESMPVTLLVRYRPGSGKIEIDALQGDSGVRLDADLKLTAQPMGLVNISADEMMYDLMRLDFARKFEIQGELAIIALKFVKFADGSGLGRILR